MIFTNRKAISQLVAALLLIAISVAAAILLYSYSIGLLGQMQSTGGQEMKAQILLEAYNWQNVNVLTMTIRNVGTIPVNLALADYFVNGNPISAATMNCGSALQPSSTCVVTVTVPNVSSGQTYPVKIVATDGAIFEYVAVCGQVG